MAKYLSTTELAKELDTDTRTLRRFLRKYPGVEAPGKGNRYTFEKRRVRGLKRAFDAWVAEDVRRQHRESDGAEREPQQSDESSEQLVDADTG